MKSDVCSILCNNDSLNEILNQVEKCAEYNKLDEKNVRQLRLLSEELVGMLPMLTDFYMGEFWIENNGSRYEIHASVNVDRKDLLYREKAMSISKSGINEDSRGLLGKIREAVEVMIENYNMAGESGMLPGDGGMGYYASQYYSQAWSMNTYINQAEDANQTEDWDELEKSIIAKYADDVVVGISKGVVHIVLKKRFNDAVQG